MAKKQPFFIVYANNPLTTREDWKPVLESLLDEFPGILRPDDASRIYSPPKPLVPSVYPDPFTTLQANAPEIIGWGIAYPRQDCEPCTFPPYHFIPGQSEERPRYCGTCFQELLRFTLDSIIEGKPLGTGHMSMWAMWANEVRRRSFRLKSSEPIDWSDLSSQVAKWDKLVDYNSYKNWDDWLIDEFTRKRHDPTIASFARFLGSYVGVSLCSFLLENKRKRIGRCGQCSKYFISKRAGARFCWKGCRDKYHNTNPEAKKRKDKYELKRTRK